MKVDDLMTWQPEVCQDASQPLRAEQEMSWKWKCPLGRAETSTAKTYLDTVGLSTVCECYLVHDFVI